MKSFVLLGASLDPDNKALYSMTKAQIMLIFKKYGIKSEIKIINIEGISKVYKLFYKDELVLIKEYGVSKKCVVDAYIKAKIFSKSNIIIEKILAADYIWDISSGNEFNDDLNITDFVIEAMVKLVVINKNKNYIILPQVIGPFKSFWRRIIAKRILNKASYVYVRDTISKDTLLFDLKIRSEVRQAVDISFYTEENLEINSGAIEQIPDNNLKIGINISSRIDDNTIIYNAIIQEIVECLNQKMIKQIVLFPYDYDDYILSKDIELKLKNKVSTNIRTVSRAYSGQDLKERIKNCDIFIGSSFYTCIDAVNFYIPTLLIAENEDFADAWRRVGLGNYLCDLTKINKKGIIAKVDEICSTREQVIKELKVIIPKLRKEIEELVL